MYNVIVVIGRDNISIPRRLYDHSSWPRGESSRNLGIRILPNPIQIQISKFSLFQFVGFGCLLVAFACCWIFMKMKLPGYLLS